MCVEQAAHDPSTSCSGSHRYREAGPTVCYIDGQSLGIAYVLQCAREIAFSNIDIKYSAVFSKGLNCSA